jgi:hypothetical protein
MQDRYRPDRAVVLPRGIHQLSRHLDDGAVVEGRYVRVAELCGRPGAVVPMNQRDLHAAAPNTRTTSRMMLSDFIA